MQLELQFWNKNLKIHSLKLLYFLNLKGYEIHLFGLDKNLLQIDIPTLPPPSNVWGGWGVGVILP